MGETVVERALSLSDSIFLVLLIGLAIGTWWIIRYAFKRNDEREKRYIKVIEVQAEALKSTDDLRSDMRDIKQLLMSESRLHGRRKV